MERPISLTWFGRAINYLLRFFFRLLYNELAWTYDWVAAIVSVGNWNRWVQSVLPFIGKEPILELGYGPGHLQFILQSRSSNAYGLDASSQMGRLTARRLAKKGLNSRISRALSQAIPFPDRTFNTIVSTFPSEYIIDPRSLGEIWRILLPGGRLVILPYAWITGNKPVERAAAWLFQVTHQSVSLPVSKIESSKHEINLLAADDLDRWFGYFARPVQEVGFQLEGKIVILESSAVALLIAEKPA